MWCRGIGSTEYPVPSTQYRVSIVEYPPLSTRYWATRSMRDEIANLVYPVIMRGLDVKDRLEHGEVVPFEVEQGTLKGLLLTDTEARRWADFGGDADAGDRRNGGA